MPGVFQKDKIVQKSSGDDREITERFEEKEEFQTAAEF